MSWHIVKYEHANGSYREVHVIPLADQRAHLIPMCWCKPRQPEGKGTHVYSHNALTVPD